MLHIPEEDILAKLRAENPWWTPPHEIARVMEQAVRRPYLARLLPLITTARPNRAVVLMGPRRVGKTWMLHQAVSALIQDGVSARSIAYVSTDHPTYHGLHLEKLVGLLQPAAGEEHPLRYVIFDEVQYLKDWETHLKRLVDDRPDLRFVASGSAAAARDERASSRAPGDSRTSASRR